MLKLSTSIHTIRLVTTLSIAYMQCCYRVCEGVHPKSLSEFKINVRTQSLDLVCYSYMHSLIVNGKQHITNLTVIMSSLGPLHGLTEFTTSLHHKCI